jgi:hypothetical protein
MPNIVIRKAYIVRSSEHLSPFTFSECPARGGIEPYPFPIFHFLPGRVE